MKSKSKVKLGEMLLDAGLINKNQLAIALTNQREWGGRLGSILVNMGFIKEEKLAQFLSHQLSIPSIDLGSIRIKDNVIKIITKEVAEKYMLMPVASKSSAGSYTVLIAMADPLDLGAIDEIQFSTGMKVKAGIAQEGAIWRAIQIYYYGNKSISPKIDTTNEPIKIDLSDIDDNLEIFRGREEATEAKPAVQSDHDIEEVLLELRAIRNILVKKGITTISEFFHEVKKLRE